MDDDVKIVDANEPTQDNYALEEKEANDSLFLGEDFNDLLQYLENQENFQIEINKKFTDEKELAKTGCLLINKLAKVHYKDKAPNAIQRVFTKKGKKYAKEEKVIQRAVVRMLKLDPKEKNIKAGLSYNNFLNKRSYEDKKEEIEKYTNDVIENDLKETTKDLLTSSFEEEIKKEFDKEEVSNNSNNVLDVFADEIEEEKEEEKDMEKLEKDIVLDDDDDDDAIMENLGEIIRQATEEKKI